jgi:5-methylcytosine-specific restriction endonuclease McrA
MTRIRRGRLARRDGWECKLCGQPIDSVLRRPNLMSASVDHRIPVSRGGSDSMDNLQLAHLRCNISKGNRS